MTDEEFSGLSLDELEKIRVDLEFNIENARNTIMEENLKMEKYKLENQRRQHNYIPMIFELLKILGEKNELESAYNTAKASMEMKK
jgi:ubiquitin carboxyl-terminal hydrolase L5